MDKEYMKTVFIKAGLSVIPYEIYRYSRWLLSDDEIISDILSKFTLPVFIKPCNLGSSVGVTKVKIPSELKIAIDTAFKYDNKIIVERGIENAKELEVAVMGNEVPEVSTVGEIIPAGEYYDYHSKYIDESSKTIVPADIPEDLKETIRQIAHDAFKSIEVYGLARVDFLYDCDEEIVYLNELNTIPGFTPISMFPKLFIHQGYSFSEIITKLIELAFERHESYRRLKRDYR